MRACIQWSAHLARGGHSDSPWPVVIHVSQLVGQPGERRGVGGERGEKREGREESRGGKRAGEEKGQEGRREEEGRRLGP